MKSLSKILTLATALTLVGAHAFANPDLVKTFKSLETKSKGPFGLNMLQGSRSKIGVLNGSPSGSFQFQAAYRNEIAQKLADTHKFYVGNLFTTNYYELMGEYVYGNRDSSHDLNHQGMANIASQIMPKAEIIVQHWVLEKHYVHANQNSPLARGFRVRGISGSEFEVEYARYFLNFFLTGVQTDQQYLTASLLAKGSPVAASNSLERARNLIAQQYDQSVLSRGEKDPLTRRLYALRNAIHNQLSQSVIGQIDAFVRDYPQYRNDSTITEIRSILVAYYAVSAKRVAEAAQKIGAANIVAVANQLQAGGNMAGFVQLSQLVADLRTQLTTPGAIAWEKKTDTLLVLNAASQYLNKELNVLKSVSGKEAFQVVVNLIYSEGFLIKDNWEYFAGEIANSADASAAGAQMPDIIGIASDTLTQAFSPALDQWLIVEPKMQYFIDNTIKSSSLNTASLLTEKIKR